MHVQKHQVNMCLPTSQQVETGGSGRGDNRGGEERDGWRERGRGMREREGEREGGGGVGGGGK